MKKSILKALFILCLWHSPIQADEIPDISMRFYAQWKVDEAGLQAIRKKYGLCRIKFDQKGHAFPQGLSTTQRSRWKRLYEQCMLDGCFFCDANVGSCETGTCGPQNASCKPFLDKRGYPKCGRECADYAFSLLSI